MFKVQSLKTYVSLCLCIASFVFFPLPLSAQQKQLIKRTTYKTEKIDFTAGGVLTIVGAPMGSISIEGWQKNEIEISAEIEVQAETESDLAELAKINDFLVDEVFGQVRVLSVGTHDKDYMRRRAKKFPRRLLIMPVKIDYRIKAPAYCDLEINGGRGDLRLEGLEGAMKINVLEGNATLNLTGGSVNAVFGSGNVDVKINGHSWAGGQADIQLARGTLNIQLPRNLNALVEATVLRKGKVESSVAALKPREGSKKFTEKSISARSGRGGALLSFTLGEGTLKINNQQLKTQN